MARSSLYFLNSKRVLVILAAGLGLFAGFQWNRAKSGKVLELHKQTHLKAIQHHKDRLEEAKSTAADRQNKLLDAHLNLLNGLEIESPNPLSFSNTFSHDFHPSPGFCSIALWGEEGFFCCDYAGVYYFDPEKRQLITMSKPGDGVWNPAGLACIREDNTVLVANYNGHDVLEFTFAGERLVLRHRYLTKGMTSPEGVATSPDGKLVAVADYDGSHLWVFHRNGELAWARKIGRAHGVAFGADSIYVTGLKDREVVRFSLTGEELRRTGSMGWGPGKYLWPTSVFSDEKGVIVSDAHTGKITFFKHDLSVAETLGGNGAVTGLFNMPYCAVRQNDKLWVTDTFKRRVLRINASHEIEWELSEFPSKSNQTADVQLTKIRWGYVDLSSRHQVTSPQFPDGMAFPAYGAVSLFDSAANRWRRLEVESGSDSIWNPGLFSYFLWMLPVKSDETDLMAIGCVSHSAVYFVDPLGRCSMEKFKGPLVQLYGTTLYRSDGSVFDIAPLAKSAARKFSQHDSLIGQGSTGGLEAARVCYWPHLTTDELKKRLAMEFRSETGRKFWEVLSKGASTKDEALAGETYDSTIEAQRRSMYLPELWTRNLLAPHRKLAK